MTPLPPTDAPAPLRIALLIDADNVHPSFADEMFAVLAELGVVTLRRAYGNFGKPEVQKWHAAMRQHAVAPVHQHDLVAGKNATDIRLAIDAIELAVEKQCDVLAIASSDSDFSPLAIRLRERGVPVIGFAQRGKTAADLAAAFDSFHLLDRQAMAGHGAPAHAAAPLAPGRSGGGTRARRPRRGAAAQAAGTQPGSARAPMTQAAAQRPAAMPAPTPAPASAAEPERASAPSRRPAFAAAPSAALAATSVAPAIAPAVATVTEDESTATPAPTPRKRRSTSKRPRTTAVSVPAESSLGTEPRDEVKEPDALAAALADANAATDTDTDTDSDAGWPAGIAAVLAAVPGLQAGVVALNSASESLRRAGILKGRSASPSRLFKKYPEYFELLPPNRPKTVHFIG